MHQKMLKAVAKLIDFGFATKLSKNRDMAKTVLGTPANIEPHLISDMERHQPNKEGYNEKVDIYNYEIYECINILIIINWKK